MSRVGDIAIFLIYNKKDIEKFCAKFLQIYKIELRFKDFKFINFFNVLF